MVQVLITQSRPLKVTTAFLGFGDHDACFRKHKLLGTGCDSISKADITWRIQGCCMTYIIPSPHVAAAVLKASVLCLNQK